MAKSLSQSKAWVTFVHGAGGSSSIWFKQLREFSKHFNVLLLDLRGHGKSRMQLSNVFKKKYTFDVLAEDILAVLDKENINGVDSILIDVVCQRQRSSDPSFSIPVHVRVTDVNDNAPLFIGAPFNLSLSEMTVVGSRILTASSTGEFLQKW